jgi:hypothetical protein
LLKLQIRLVMVIKGRSTIFSNSGIKTSPFSFITIISSLRRWIARGRGMKNQSEFLKE